MSFGRNTKYKPSVEETAAEKEEAKKTAEKAKKIARNNEIELINDILNTINYNCNLLVNFYKKFPIAKTSISIQYIQRFFQELLNQLNNLLHFQKKMTKEHIPFANTLNRNISSKLQKLDEKLKKHTATESKADTLATYLDEAKNFTGKMARVRSPQEEAMHFVLFIENHPQHYDEILEIFSSNETFRNILYQDPDFFKMISIMTNPEKILKKVKDIARAATESSAINDDIEVAIEDRPKLDFPTLLMFYKFPNILRPMLEQLEDSGESASHEFFMTLMAQLCPEIFVPEEPENTEKASDKLAASGAGSGSGSGSAEVAEVKIAAPAAPLSPKVSDPSAISVAPVSIFKTASQQAAAHGIKRPHEEEDSNDDKANPAKRQRLEDGSVAPARSGSP